MILRPGSLCAVHRGVLTQLLLHLLAEWRIYISCISGAHRHQLPVRQVRLCNHLLPLRLLWMWMRSRNNNSLRRRARGRTFAMCVVTLPLPRALVTTGECVQQIGLAFPGPVWLLLRKTGPAFSPTLSVAHYSTPSL